MRARRFRISLLGAGFGLVLLCGLSALGCSSGGSGDSEKSAASPTSTNVEFELDIAGCGGFAPADAAQLLGVPVGALQDRSQDISDHSRWCIYSNAQDPEKGVTFTVEREESIDDAVIAFDQFRGHVGVAVGVLGQEGDQAHNIAGLGDEALWTPVPGGVYARKGRYSVQVNQPSDEQVQIAIAKRILHET